MDSYIDFAAVYDELQKDVAYKNIAGFIHEMIERYSSEKEVVVDLACGTGSLCEELFQLGYDVIGVDISEQMLGQAMSKPHSEEITYLHQNMTELDLWGQADAIVCTLDSINHLPNVQAVNEVLEKAGQFVYKGGLFIFDINTVYKHREVLDNNTFVYDEPNVYCIWQNHLNEDSSVDISLDFFIKDSDGKYTRAGEDFSEIAVEESVIDCAVEKNGFEIIKVCDGYNDQPLKEKSQRAVYVCRKL